MLLNSQLWKKYLSWFYNLLSPSLLIFLMHASLFDKMEQCMTEYIFKFLRSCQAARSSEIVLLSQFHNNSKLLEDTKIFTVT